jgi:hypothetical protein
MEVVHIVDLLTVSEEQPLGFERQLLCGEQQELLDGQVQRDDENLRLVGVGVVHDRYATLRHGGGRKTEAEAICTARDSREAEAEESALAAHDQLLLLLLLACVRTQLLLSEKAVP